MLATKNELIHSNNHTILNELHNLSQLGIFLPTLIFARYAQPNPSYVVDELNNPECTHPSLALRFLGGNPFSGILWNATHSSREISVVSTIVVLWTLIQIKILFKSSVSLPYSFSLLIRDQSLVLKWAGIGVQPCIQFSNKSPVPVPSMMILRVMAAWPIYAAQTNAASFSICSSPNYYTWCFSPLHANTHWKNVWDYESPSQGRTTHVQFIFPKN